MRNEMTTLVTLSDGYDHVREAYYDKGRQLVFTEWTSVKELDSRFININERKELSDEGEWISVSERLPEDMQRVLIWFEYYRYGDFNCMYQTYGFGYVCDGKWSPFINGETGWQDYRIIAWQPLPEPYREGGTEE